MQHQPVLLQRHRLRRRITDDPGIVGMNAAPPRWRGPAWPIHPKPSVRRQRRAPRRIDPFGRLRPGEQPHLGPTDPAYRPATAIQTFRVQDAYVVGISQFASALMRYRRSPA